jgi:hypothetical protein
MTRRLASLHGVRADSRSPASTVLSRRYDSLPPIPPHFVSFAWRYRSGRLRLASAGGKRQTPADRDALVTRVPHTPGVSCGNDRASHVPGEPSCAYALLSDPGRTDASGHHDAPTRPPHCTTTRAPACNLSFGAQSHGLGTRCLCFAAPVTRAPRKTRFRLPASSAGRVWLPAGFHRKVSECYSSMAIILLSQAFVAQGP